ncbi:MAG: CHAT domain-containing protein [Cyanobacteria bacterium P01_G01_bin.54]
MLNTDMMRSLLLSFCRRLLNGRLDSRLWRRGLAALLGLGLTLMLSGWPLAVTAQDVPLDEPTLQGVPTDTLPTTSLEAGRFYHRQGRYAQALAAWEQATAEFAVAGDRHQQALSLSYVSMVQQDLGNWSAAETAIAQSLELLQAETTPPAILLAQALNTQATLRFNQSQFQPAFEQWQQAEVYYREAGDELGAWGAGINQAQALKELGFYRRANQMLLTINQALANAPDSEVKVTGLRTLSNALQAVGNGRISYDALVYSLTLAKQLGLNRHISGLHHQIGRLALQLGDPQRALTEFQTANRLAGQSLDRLRAQLGMLDVYLLDGQWSTARAVATPLYEQLVTLPPSRDQIYGAIHLAHQVQQFPSDTESSLSPRQLEQLLIDASAAANQFQDQRAVAHILRERGAIYTQAQQSSRAIELTQQSVNLARSLPADDILAPSAWQLARLLRDQGNRPDAIAVYNQAVNALQTLRGDLIAINQDLQFSFREQVEPVYRELVSLLLEGQPRPSELEQARNTLEGLQLAELDNYFQEACLDLETRTIDQIDPTATVLYPIILPDKLAVIVARPGQTLDYYQTPMGQTDLNWQLRRFLASLHPSSDHRRRLTQAQQLYDLLIRPAEERQLLAGTQTLVFVLDGLLRNIPMAALHDGQQYLIEQYAIALSPGLQLLDAQVLDAQNFQVLVGGISEARGGFTALPAVEQEVETIEELTDSTALLNAEFTSEAVSQAVQNGSADVVHLATHGQFSSNPEETFFLTWEGAINVRELADILQNRQRTGGKAIELLVLSACETATGDDRATLGLAGLAVKSGARSTLATLWPIKDNVAAQLMIDFYEQLQTPGLSRAEALRQAQLNLLAEPSYRDPFFWSPYTLVGNWR